MMEDVHASCWVLEMRNSDDVGAQKLVEIGESAVAQHFNSIYYCVPRCWNVLEVTSGFVLRRPSYTLNLPESRSDTSSNNSDRSSNSRSIKMGRCVIVV